MNPEFFFTANSIGAILAALNQKWSLCAVFVITAAALGVFLILNALRDLEKTLREIADSKTHITFTSDPDARRSSIERHYGT